MGHLVATPLVLKGPWVDRMSRPGALARSPGGSLFIADKGARQVWVVRDDMTPTPLFWMPPAPDRRSAEPTQRDSMPVGDVLIYEPSGIAIDADGVVYVADRVGQVILVDRADQARHITRHGGDKFYECPRRAAPKGRIARNYRLWNPSAIALNAEGSLLVGCAGGLSPRHYVVEITAEHRIFPAAGMGIDGDEGDGGDATLARLYRPQGLAVAPDGSFYVSTGRNNIRKISRNGIITRFAGGSKAGYKGDGGPAEAALLAGPTDLVVTNEMTLIIADFYNECVRSVAPDGSISTILGNGVGLLKTSDGSYEELNLRPDGLALSSDGQLTISDRGRILVVDLSMRVEPTVLKAPQTWSGEGLVGSAAVAASLPAPEILRRERLPLLGVPMAHKVLIDVLESVRVEARPDGSMARGGTRLDTVDAGGHGAFGGQRGQVQGNASDYDSIWVDGSAQIEWMSTGWDSSTQDAFDEAWSDEGRQVMSRVVDRYRWKWNEALETIVRREHPHLWERIERLALRTDFWPEGRDAPTRRLPFIDRKLSIGMDQRCSETVLVGAFRSYRCRSSIPEPSRTPTACVLCGEGFLEVSAHRVFHKLFGSIRYCIECSWMAYNGLSPLADKGTIAESLQRLAELHDWIPGSRFRSVNLSLDLDDSVRDGIAAELVILPEISTIREVFDRTWPGVLQEVGLIGETWRPSFGTYCVADDGHQCRSLFEKQIDDWMHANGVEHEVEPLWPWHNGLNPDQGMRADWSLRDGTYVEAAGMMSNRAYRTKMERKVELAEATGLRLIVIEPGDLGELGNVLGDFSTAEKKGGLGGR